jgi:hypothetical protein
MEHHVSGRIAHLALQIAGHGAAFRDGGPTASHSHPAMSNQQVHSVTQSGATQESNCPIRKQAWLRIAVPGGPAGACTHNRGQRWEP